MAKPCIITTAYNYECVVGDQVEPTAVEGEKLSGPGRVSVGLTREKLIYLQRRRGAQDLPRPERPQ